MGNEQAGGTGTPSDTEILDWLQSNVGDTGGKFMMCWNVCAVESGRGPQDGAFDIRELLSVGYGPGDGPGDGPCLTDVEIIDILQRHTGNAGAGVRLRRGWADYMQLADATPYSAREYLTRVIADCAEHPLLPRAPHLYDMTRDDLGCPSDDLGCPSDDLGCPSDDLGCPSDDLGCPSAPFPGNSTPRRTVTAPAAPGSGRRRRSPAAWWG